MAAWQRRSTRRVYRNAYVAAYADVLISPRGGTMEFLRLVGPSFACVVALSSDDRIVFVREYRPALRRTLLELPGGMIEPGETARHAARRELEEETGYRAGTLTSLGWFYPSPTRSASRAYLFLARGLRPGHRHPDSTEDLRTVEIARPRAYARLRGGTIYHPAAIVGLSRAEPLLRVARRAPRSKRLIPRVAGSNRSGVG